ncbi:MAG TPA: cupin domain-containing protein [Pyrinomonadaceae bacterium]|nr:cupin domain-containing protein [Pyrinomonadaceae bacterium]
MKQAIVLGSVFALGILVGRMSGESVHAQVQPYETKQILRTDLKNLPGQELLIFASTWQPGARLPLHMHPDGHEVTYVIEGEQTFEVDGVGTNIIVKAGEALYTPPNTPHFGRNATDRISKTLVVRIKDKDKPIKIDVKR